MPKGFPTKMPSNVFINKRERPDDDDVDVDIHRKTGGMFVLLKTPIVVSNTFAWINKSRPLSCRHKWKGYDLQDDFLGMGIRIAYTCGAQAPTKMPLLKQLFINLNIRIRFGCSSTCRLFINHTKRPQGHKSIMWQKDRQSIRLAGQKKNRIKFLIRFSNGFSPENYCSTGKLHINHHFF